MILFAKSGQVRFANKSVRKIYVLVETFMCISMAARQLCSRDITISMGEQSQ
jgi:hypothetical protein